MNIGFIGLGNMGSGMAANLLAYCQREGHQLSVLDINPAAVALLEAKGATAASSAGELAAASEVLFTSLPSSKEINALALGDAGILNNLKPGAVWFDTSTNEVSAWEALRAQAVEGIDLVDAPVTGGSEGAAAGTLTMLLGGDKEVVERYRPLLESFTKRAVYMGPAGAGYTTKLAQLHLNYLVAQGIGEALMLGAKAKLDLNTLYDVLNNSCARSYVVENYIPKVLDGSYDRSFKLGLAEKDMRLINQLGEHLDIELTLGSVVYDTYQKATKAYGFDAPHLSVVRLIEDQSNTLLRE
ncbi:MAG: NAD(P)-dependent oxidoreductase [Oceanospirillaceae bacterium]|nr:NAD(P)-dependent oxidoreductase [Oceanospirillaceae bacterium]